MKVFVTGAVGAPTVGYSRSGQGQPLVLLHVHQAPNPPRSPDAATCP